MGPVQVRLDDHRVVGVVQRDQLVSLVGKGGAGLLEVPGHLLRAVVDLAGAHQLVAGMVEGRDRRLVVVTVLRLHVLDHELLARATQLLAHGHAADSIRSPPCCKMGAMDTAPSGSEPSGGIASGAVFAGFRIEAEIGRGGMGVVYRARHLALDREEALKVISPALSTDRRFRERFQRESRLAASLEHPNVVPVDHAGDEQGTLYLSMRLVEGSDLRTVVEAEGPLDPARVARLVGGVAAGPRRRPRSAAWSTAT